MAVDHIRYDLLTQEALRDVIRKVLIDAAKNGLPGDHHFFIAFDTRAAGVRLSAAMRTQYPEEMTIILQHQFWDLSVNDEALEVGLSFGGVAERLRVPFAAIKSFFDPSVQFGLQFQTAEESAESTPAPERSEAEVTPLSPAAGSTLRVLESKPKSKSSGSKSQSGKSETKNETKTDTKTDTKTGHRKSPERDAETAEDKANEAQAQSGVPDTPPAKPEGGGEVVRLDRFRKK